MPHIRVLLTFVVGSERFEEGARSAMFSDGTVRWILERLSGLEQDLKKSGRQDSGTSRSWCADRSASPCYRCPRPVGLEAAIPTKHHVVA